MPIGLVCRLNERYAWPRSRTDVACAVRDERHDPLSVALWCWVTGPGNEGGDGVATECPPARAGKAAATITRELASPQAEKAYGVGAVRMNHLSRRETELRADQPPAGTCSRRSSVSEETPGTSTKSPRRAGGGCRRFDSTRLAPTLLAVSPRSRRAGRRRRAGRPRTAPGQDRPCPGGARRAEGGRAPAAVSRKSGGAASLKSVRIDTDASVT